MTPEAPPNPPLEHRLRCHSLQPLGGSLSRPEPLDVDLRPGEMLAVIGPAGSGKSSLLRTIAGLEDPVAGGALLHGFPVWSLPSAGPRPGLITKASRLHEAWSADRAIRAGLETADWPGDGLDAKVSAVLEPLALSGHAAKVPAELTTAERHRMVIARELASFPTLLLLDDPYSGETPATRQEIAGTIKSAREGLGTTVVYAASEADEISALATHTTSLAVPVDVAPLISFVRKYAGGSKASGDAARAAEGKAESGDDAPIESLGAPSPETRTGDSGAAGELPPRPAAGPPPGPPAVPAGARFAAPRPPGGPSVPGAVEPRWVAALCLGHGVVGSAEGREARLLTAAGYGHVGAAREAQLVLDLGGLPGMHVLGRPASGWMARPEPAAGLAWAATGSVRAETGFRRPYGGPVVVDIRAGEDDGSARALLVDLAEATPAQRLELLGDHPAKGRHHLVLVLWRGPEDTPALRRLAREAGPGRGCIPVVVPSAGTAAPGGQLYPYCYLRTSPRHPSPWRSLTRGRVVTALPGAAVPGTALPTGGWDQGEGLDLLGPPDLVLGVEHYRRQAAAALQRQAVDPAGGGGHDPIYAAALWALSSGCPGLAMSLLRAGGRHSE